MPDSRASRGPKDRSPSRTLLFAPLRALLFVPLRALLFVPLRGNPKGPARQNESCGQSPTNGGARFGCGPPTTCRKCWWRRQMWRMPWRRCGRGRAPLLLLWRTGKELVRSYLASCCITHCCEDTTLARARSSMRCAGCANRNQKPGRKRNRCLARIPSGRRIRGVGSCRRSSTGAAPMEGGVRGKRS